MVTLFKGDKRMSTLRKSSNPCFLRWVELEVDWRDGQCRNLFLSWSFHASFFLGKLLEELGNLCTGTEMNSSVDCE